MAQNLFDEFEEVSAKAWKQKIQYDLKGADYNSSLVWESPEGIKVKPFYHADDVEGTFKYATNVPTDWKIAQEIYAADVEKANQRAMDAVHRGTESLIFIIPSENIAISELLAGIDLEVINIHFNLHFLSPEFIRKIGDFARKNYKFYLNIDIIGRLARTGNWFSGIEKDHEDLGQILADSKTYGQSHILSIDVALYQNAGANIVQQLAYALAHANEYLNHFSPALLGCPTFTVAVGPNYCFEIAKLRALRLLWKTLASEYGTTEDCHIFATPSHRNKTLYDYNINMLRTTSECMSAVLGGADTVCNLGYDAIYHKNNEFGERIARNQLLIMKNESHLDKVDNPADGSYYLETLTWQLAEKALTLFKSIEAGDGLLKQLKNHTLQKKIRESAQKEQNLFNQKEEILVGTNAYQNQNDRMKNDLELYPFVRTNKRKTLIEPLLEKRWAEELEQKRLRDE